MPIRPENRSKYPPNWTEIAERIKWERAGGRCEMLTLDGERCTAVHGSRHPWTGSIVVLTCAHLNHDETDCSDENLRAACQCCHNRYDFAHRLRNRQRRERRERRKQKELQFA
jgi:hypothetical protein